MCICLSDLLRVLRDPTAASPWFSIVVYPDLVRDKDLALVRGDFLPNLQKQVVCEDDLSSSHSSRCGAFLSIRKLKLYWAWQWMHTLQVSPSAGSWRASITRRDSLTLSGTSACAGPSTSAGAQSKEIKNEAFTIYS